MEKEVDPKVLAVINEKRLRGEKRTPVEIISKMGVFEANQKASEQAWLATGDNVIATIWAELANVGADGQWFYVESLDTQHSVGGGERTELQQQRAKDRLKLLKRSLDAGQGFRAVLQTNRVSILELESNKAAKVSVRIQDEVEWHVAKWAPDEFIAVLVRGPRGWVPGDDDMQAAKSRGAVPVAPVVAPAGQYTPDEVQAGAIDHLTRHFSGYGYKVENVADQALGYDLEVTDKKGNTLLQLAVKGTASGMKSFKLTSEERAWLNKDGPWRMAVVADPNGPTANHKIYKSTEVNNASGLEPLL